MSKRDSDGRPILTRFNWSWWESEIQPWLSSKGLWRYVKGAPSTLYIDNNSALQVAKNPEHHGRMKHLDLRFYWLRDEVHRGSIRLVHLQTADMPADMLTKALGRVKLQHMAALSGLGVGR